MDILRLEEAARSLSRLIVESNNSLELRRITARDYVRALSITMDKEELNELHLFVVEHGYLSARTSEIVFESSL